ncbi:MAG: hypothetical protein COW00_02735 [Bdellovibrio sp. CG12_big_fil_rev_8_21_14_0_65_39_13]|nr:MAG: hypothetical protein COW78_04000 [Bdellovibrio sp. CG22_combo_CG10-13_8_21_14_all_39_27]PIQ61974.1 MAG: hypothetical protein COW00_02735 [Bdellovibrio sp. CG12_big_fil_rev_8_21_14_0_65_39_13]PIR32610.1 MAG: hypothetical protein COV37_19285 [Bdellovibrio sp. CG11_big_fil_rev_8_21_14_0_20_39_38]
MSYSEILKLKKEEKNTRERIFARHIVVGEDVFAVSLYQTLVQKYGESEVRILTDRTLNQEEIYPKGPSPLRGEASIKLMEKLFPHLTISSIEKSSVFFKDMEFKPFSGRAKSEKLLWSEDFFVAPRAIIDWSAVCPVLNDQEALQKMDQVRLNYLLSGIKKVEPNDLVEPAHFQLQTTKGLDIECENLYWGRGPLSFLDLFQNKELLSDQFIEFCEHTRTPSTLHMKFEFETPITDMTETIFIPLSYTHEWGHFIGEFTEASEGKQIAEFMCFVDPEHNDEEELSKKVRMLKKSLEKIFEKFNGTKYVEFISLIDSSPSLTIDDTAYGQLASELDHLKMVATNAPLINFDILDTEAEIASSEIQFFARSMANMRSIEASL